MPSSRYARRRQGSKTSLFVHHNYRKLKRCCNQPQLQHKASRSTSGFESSTRGDRTTNNCIFRQSINKQINTGYPAKCRTRFMQWPVVPNLKKYIF